MNQMNATGNLSNVSKLSNVINASAEVYNKAPTAVNTLMKFNTSGPTIAPTAGGPQFPLPVIIFISLLLIPVIGIVIYIVVGKCRERQEESYELNAREPRKESI